MQQPQGPWILCGKWALPPWGVLRFSPCPQDCANQVPLSPHFSLYLQVPLTGGKLLEASSQGIHERRGPRGSLEGLLPEPGEAGWAGCISQRLSRASSLGMCTRVGTKGSTVLDPTGSMSRRGILLTAQHPDPGLLALPIPVLYLSPGL